MLHTESRRRRRDVPVSVAGVPRPSWKWLDEIFHESDWHQMIKIEECREGDSVIVRAELPGLNPEEDIEVQVLHSALVISAEKTETHESNEHHFHRSEFRHGSLTRSVPIPSGVDKSRITATYKDGVLEVRMVMPTGTTPEQSRRIPITRS